MMCTALKEYAQALTQSPGLQEFTLLKSFVGSSPLAIISVPCFSTYINRGNTNKSARILLKMRPSVKVAVLNLESG